MKTYQFEDKDSIVSLSGGIDSTVLLQWVKENVSTRIAGLFLNLGQESAQKQLAYAHKICNDLGIPLHIADLPGYVNLVAGVSSPHIFVAEHDERGDADKLRGPIESDGSRLFSMFSALRLNYKIFYDGLTKTDAKRWQINQTERINAINHILDISARGLIRYSTPFIESDMENEDILKLAIDKGYDYQNTWSCLWGYRYHCGNCSACKKRRRSFNILNLKDDTRYLGNWPDTGTEHIPH